jgi:NhaP-type Na+/H+ or K+/H+ antiporter
MPPLKDILGKPGQGIHFHFLGIAVLDVLATVLLGAAMGWLTCWLTDSMPMIWFVAVLYVVILFAIGEALHLIIGVDTTVARWLQE